MYLVRWGNDQRKVKPVEPSVLDHYTHRSSNSTFEFMTLLHFSQHYTMSKELGSASKHHKMKSPVLLTRSKWS